MNSVVGKTLSRFDVSLDLSNFKNIFWMVLSEKTQEKSNVILSSVTHNDITVGYNQFFAELHGVFNLS